MSEQEHEHAFQVKYRVIDGKSVFEPEAQCSGCAARVLVHFDGWRLMLTYSNVEPHYRYRIVVQEAQP